MTNRFDEIIERSKLFARRIWDCCNWKTVAISLFFTISLSLLIMGGLLRENLIPSTPAQMLGCLAYLWDLFITTRLCAIGCTIIVAPLIFLGILCGFSLMDDDRRESMTRFGFFSILPVLYLIALGRYSVNSPIDYSWIIISCLLFSAVFWLQLWRKECASDMDFVLLFCSFFIPFGFCCLARAVCYRWFPEDYPAFFDWGCRKLKTLPYLSFGMTLILLTFPKNGSEHYRRILYAALQLLMLPLFTWLLPQIYLRDNQLIALHSYGKTFWYIVFPLLLLATADILLRAWKPGLMKRAISPFPLMAVLAFEAFDHSSVIGLTNFFEFGDRIADYYAVHSGAMTIFKDTTPTYGLWDYWFMRLTDFFSNTFTMADTYGFSLMELFALFVSFYAFFHLLPLWIAFLIAFFWGGCFNTAFTFSVVLVALIMIWIHPGFLKRRGLWCAFWSITTAFVVFFRIPQGAMLAVAFLPLFLYQFFRVFKEDKRLGWKLLVFEIFWASLFLVWPFSPYFYGLARIFYETGSINNAWAALEWRLGYGSGALLPFAAANAILFLPVITIFLSGLVIVSDVPVTADNKKTFAWGIFSASLCYTFISLNYSYSRIDGVFSRQFQTFLILLPFLLVPVLFLPGKLKRIKLLLIVLSFAPGTAFLIHHPNPPESPLNAIRNPLPTISDEEMVHGEDFGLPKAGYGIASEECRKELQAERELKTVLDQVLAPDETFLNLSLYGGLYFLFDREMPARHSNYYTVTGDLTQFHMLKQLSGKNVVVSVFGRDYFDYSYPMLRAFYLYRYAIKDAFPLKVNDKYFILMPEAYFRKIGQTAPSLEESLEIWEDFFNSGATLYQFDNLVYSTAVWGRNSKKLLRDMSEASMELPLPQGDALQQQVQFAQPLSGDQWGILEIDSDQECWAGVIWTNEFQKPYKIYFKLARGKSLVPLDIYPHWFQAKENREFTFFSQDHELKITGLTLHRRKLPHEILRKKTGD
jgi:hypothetical protein